MRLSGTLCGVPTFSPIVPPINGTKTPSVRSTPGCVPLVSGPDKSKLSEPPRGSRSLHKHRNCHAVQPAVSSSDRAKEAHGRGSGGCSPKIVGLAFGQQCLHGHPARYERPLDIELLDP